MTPWLVTGASFYFGEGREEMSDDPMSLEMALAILERRVDYLAARVVERVSRESAYHDRLELLALQFAIKRLGRKE